LLFLLKMYTKRADWKSALFVFVVFKEYYYP
jgi:hypothetical protein